MDRGRKQALARIWYAVRDAIPTLRMDHRLKMMERFSHGARSTYLGNNRVVTKAVVGSKQIAFLLQADDLLLTPFFLVSGKYETALTRWFLNALRPDSHCIDVGANFGYFSCVMAHHCPQGRVIGIEADPIVAALARDNVIVNDLQDIAAIVIGAAIDRDGEATLYRRSRRSGNNSLFAAGDAFTESFGEAPEEAFVTPALRIDSLLDRMGGRIDFLKIDVEGAEPLALAGARETIAANPQIRIVMEWSPNQLRSGGFDVAGFAREIVATGLRPFDIAGRRPVALSVDEFALLPHRAGVLLTAG